MKILNLLSSGGIGGIEVLCKNIGMHAKYENSFCFLFDEGQIYEEMNAENLSVISLVKYGSKKITLKKIKQLKCLAKQHDIVVTHHANISLQVIYFILRHILRRKKYVMVAHSCFDAKEYYSYKSKLKNKIFAFLLEENLKGSDGIIFVSEAGKRSYQEEFRFNEDRTRVIYNGVPCEIKDSKIAYERNDISKIRMLYVGRLVEIKGVQLLIEAVDKMVMDGMSCELKIVGDGAYRKKLEQMVSEKCLSSYITFEGKQRMLKRYYNDTDIFVYPSICQEVFGISIVEAMAEGVPCVAFNVGGIPEIVIEGVNGELALEKSGEALKNAIMRVWDMQNKENGFQNLRKNCIDTAKRFSIDSTVTELEIFYEELF